eukprot:636928-Rhodomonas_salina.1
MPRPELTRMCVCGPHRADSLPPATPLLAPASLHDRKLRRRGAGGRVAMDAQSSRVQRGMRGRRVGKVLGGEQRAAARRGSSSRSSTLVGAAGPSSAPGRTAPASARRERGARTGGDGGRDGDAGGSCGGCCTAAALHGGRLVVPRRLSVVAEASAGAARADRGVSLGGARGGARGCHARAREGGARAQHDRAVSALQSLALRVPGLPQTGARLLARACPSA